VIRPGFWSLKKRGGVRKFFALGISRASGHPKRPCYGSTLRRVARFASSISIHPPITGRFATHKSVLSAAADCPRGSRAGSKIDLEQES
jgi:hypothetical protein